MATWLTMDPRTTRRRWTILEPLHAVVYFAPEVPEADAALGLRGFWMSYFAGRAAPLGPVGPEPVIASFFNFAPPMVRRALPDAWALATPDEVLSTRLESVDTVLRRLLGEAVDHPEVREAAELAGDAAARCPIEGRPLAAAWSAVDPRTPIPPHVRLWLACTVLREHRGDGHVAALVEAGLDGCEVHVALAATGAVTRASQLGARGWTEEDWDAAADRLTDRGWLSGDTLTAAGRAAHDAIEATTDRLASAPWEALGDGAADRFDELVTPLTARITAHELIRYPNPMGLPAPA